MLNQRRFVQGLGGGVLLSASGLPLLGGRSAPTQRMRRGVRRAARERAEEWQWVAGVRAWF